ncbi:MAG TPA: serine/threonine-protein kinase [archaeon]|nr:serine/threonine-protein kinase [archaeon]
MTDQESLVFEAGGRRYVDGEQIGGGGMAHIYSAVDEETGEVVAIKIYRDGCEGALDSSVRAHRLLNGVGSFPRLHYSDDSSYVMDYVDGVNLHNLQLPDETAVLTVGYDVAMCLADLHENLPDPIIHRDVKPSNIVLRYDGVSVLVDFDFAYVDVLSRHSATENVGTTQFLSPEQFCHSQVGPKSDIFSLGSTMYNLLTGQYLREPHVRLTEAAADKLPQGRPRDIVARCWRLEREYRSAFFLSEDIRNALEESGIDIEESRRALTELVKESN